MPNMPPRSVSQLRPCAHAAPFPFASMVDASPWSAIPPASTRLFQAGRTTAASLTIPRHARKSAAKVRFPRNILDSTVPDVDESLVRHRATSCLGRSSHHDPRHAWHGHVRRWWFLHPRRHACRQRGLHQPARWHGAIRERPTGRHRRL